MGVPYTCRLGRGLRPHRAGALDSLRSSVQFGATGHAANPVLPVGGAAVALPNVSIAIELLEVGGLQQSTQWPGSFPCREAAATQGVGAGDGEMAHLRDHMTDVVAVTDETAANNRL